MTGPEPSVGSEEQGEPVCVRCKLEKGVHSRLWHPFQLTSPPSEEDSLAVVRNLNGRYRLWELLRVAGGVQREAK